MSASKILVLRELQKQEGQKVQDIAGKLRISLKHARKMLTQLKQAGEVDWVRKNTETRWYLPAAARAIKKEAQEDRKLQKLCYLIEWRARKRESMPVPLSRPAASVFQLGAV